MWHLYASVIFSAPESKVQVLYCDNALSVHPSLTFDIFDSFSETAERNMLKHDGKNSTSSTMYVFFGPIGKTRWPPGLLLTETFKTCPLKPLNGICRNLTKSKISNFLYKLCVFRADRKNKMAATAYDYLRHFRLLFWNNWICQISAGGKN